jgi:hypothetical protein
MPLRSLWTVHFNYPAIAGLKDSTENLRSTFKERVNLQTTTWTTTYGIAISTRSSGARLKMKSGTATTGDSRERRRDPPVVHNHGAISLDAANDHWKPILRKGLPDTRDRSGDSGPYDQWSKSRRNDCRHLTGLVVAERRARTAPIDALSRSE